MRPFKVLLLLPVFLLPGACQEQTPQTGHRVIAEAVRGLLDKSYAGIDYPSYRDSLKNLETTTAAHLTTTPAQLRDQAEQMLTYLRAAEEVLRWQSEPSKTIERAADDRMVAAWIEHYPFLQVAVGAQLPDVFDAHTATMLLWDKTDEVLRGFQVKSKPL